MVTRAKIHRRFNCGTGRTSGQPFCRIEQLEGRTLLSSAVPAGPEFRVNTYTAGGQGTGGVAMDANGNFVCTWTSSNPNNPAQTGYFAQRYNAAGVPQGAAFRVTTSTTGGIGNPSIAMDPAGDFVVTWGGAKGLGDSFSGVYAQRFNAAGVKVGPEFRVNTYTPDNQYGATVAMDAHGNFTIAWHSQESSAGPFDIHAQRFAADGTPVGAEFRVNTTTSGQQEWPSIAMNAAGDSVITWCYNGVGDSDGVFAQRYNAAGVKQGSEFRVNTYTAGSQALPCAAMDPSGNFVITWVSDLQDGSVSGIYAQRFSSSGVPLGPEFRANTYTSNWQGLPAVACDGTGGFVITWTSDGQDGSGQGVFAQRYDATGSPIDGEFQVNTYTPGNQRKPAVGADPAGDFVIAWNSDGQDGSGYGDYAQRYTVPPAAQPLTAFAAASKPSTSGKPVRVYAPHTHGIGEASADWWQWALSFSNDGPNPFTDPTGGLAGMNQSDHIFFMPGISGPGPFNRTVHVPAGKPLLVPLVVTELSTLEGAGNTPKEVRAADKAFADLIDGLAVTIDGVAVPDLFSHREVSPTFHFVAAPNNPIGDPAGDSGIAEADGYWLMLAPMSAGTHVIYNRGTVSSLDAAFEVTTTVVVDGKASPHQDTASVVAATPVVPAGLWSSSGPWSEDNLNKARARHAARRAAWAGA